MQLEQKRADEKLERDRLNKIYLELVEKQRSYYKTVRDFQEVRVYACGCTCGRGMEDSLASQTSVKNGVW